MTGAFGASLRLAVVQPLPGIGDMVWHLPHIRALAQAAGRPVTLVAKRNSRADELFGGDPGIGDIMWLPRNSRGLHVVSAIARLATDLRARRLDAVVLLHGSSTLAAGIRLSGVGRRYGYGYGGQRRFLNRPPFLADAMWSAHPFAQASAWLNAAGIAQPEPEPMLAITAQSRAAALTRLAEGAAFAVPVAAVGIGSSEAAKQWGAARFAELILGLRAAGWTRCVLVGGPAEAALAAEIQRRLPGPPPALALGWPLGELAALLASAAFYVGNDTGGANLAAAVGTRTICLFGATPPLTHSRNIVPVLPAGGVDKAHGMERITAAAVLAAITAEVPPVFDAV